ncbi:MAG: DnaJ domain-containing protein [Polyangiaceae bacterium]|nr:DnaJ domain-containing protein [Polyangiaceae bacterium]
MSDQRATSTGKLADRSLPELIYALAARKSTGSMILEAPGGKRSAVGIVNGSVTKVQSAEAVHRLGAVLHEMDAVSPMALSKALKAAQKAERLLGEELVSRELIDDLALQEALQTQLQQKFCWAAALPPETVYGYYDNVDYLQSAHGPDAPPLCLPLLWQSVRDAEVSARASGMLDKAGSHLLKLGDSRVLAPFNFAKEELDLLSKMDGEPKTLPVLLTLGDPELLAKMAYWLLVTRQLTVHRAAAPPEPDSTSDGADPDATPQSQPPVNRQAAVKATQPAAVPNDKPPVQKSKAAPALPKKKPRPPVPSKAPTQDAATPSAGSVATMAAMKAEAEKLLSSYDDLNHYEILGVGQKVSKEVIGKAFIALARNWHPDKLPADFGSIKGLATQVFGRMSEAAKALQNEHSRKDHDILVEQGGATVAEQKLVQKAFDAAMAFDAAEEALKKGYLDVAFKEIDKATSLDDTRAEYAALKVWLHSHDRKRRESADYDDLIPLMNSACDLHPENITARMYRAQLLKLSGRADQALSDYMFVYRANPHNLDAKREIRLHKMRREENAGTKSDPKGKSKGKGILGFFKR